MTYKVIEIFDSIDGEGIRMGQPVSFIRLAGCNLRCSYCDTAYSLFDEEEPCLYENLAQDEILKRINEKYKRITLTGGEPLISIGADVLVSSLVDEGYEVNIETNGAVDICEFSKKTKRRDGYFFTIDYKLPSSKMQDKMIWNNFLNLEERDVIKFVVGSDEDVKVMLDVMKKLKKHYKKMPQVFVGAVYGKFSLQRLAEIVLEEDTLADAKIQVQLHKIIWDPEKRGV